LHVAVAQHAVGADAVALHDVLHQRQQQVDLRLETAARLTLQ
jgi:hypothetical protein